jgi:hypothetical protein
MRSTDLYREETFSVRACRWARDLTHISRDKEVVMGEFEVVATGQDRWLAGKDEVGGHLMVG